MNRKVYKGRPAEVLLVEDNESDVVMTRAAFAEARFAVNMHDVPDGEQALQFLRKQGKFEGVASPDLILLDLNMPVMNGREVLEELVNDESLRHFPVVVLTTSDNDRDILDMYSLRCSSYVTKPVNFDNFREAVQDIGDYWFTLVVLPDQVK